ncbi:MAG: RNA polymerase sigma factor [Planctomycetota bacterium]
MQEINTRKRDRAEIVLDLFEMYHDRVYAFARKSAEPAVAEDATQEAFVRLLQHPRLEELDISISYLLKIVHNILRRRFTRSVRLREIVEVKIKPRIRQNEEDSSPQPLRVAEHLTNLGQVEQAFGRLSPDERDALGVSVTTINNWKHRGLSKLRGQLESEGRGGRGHAPARHSRSA